MPRHHQHWLTVSNQMPQAMLNHRPIKKMKNSRTTTISSLRPILGHRAHRLDPQADRPLDLQAEDRVQVEDRAQAEALEDKQVRAETVIGNMEEDEHKTKSKNSTRLIFFLIENLQRHS